MKLHPKKSITDIFIAFHFFIQLYGHFLIIYVCDFLKLESSINPKSYFLIGFYLLLLGQKIKNEGASFTILLSLFVEASFILSAFQIFPNFFYGLANFFYFCFLFSLYILQQFEIPSKNFPFKVGYRHFILDKIANNSKNVAVFYPTNETTNDVSWLTDEQFLINLLKKYIPNYLMSITLFCLSFLYHVKLGVNLKSKLSDLAYSDFIEKEKYPVVIFSSGLNGNRHCYSVFSKWFASQGAIVFCIESDDNLKDLQSSFKKRYMEIKVLIDFIYDPKQIDELFEEKIQLNYEKISIGGHSLGGGTAILTSILEKRITGGVLALDPSVTLIDDLTLNIEWDKPFLSICTERYNKSFLKKHDKMLKIFNINKAKSQSLFCYLKNSSYFQQGDFVCLLPRLINLLNIFEQKRNVEEQLEFNIKLLELFLSEVICQNKGIDSVKGKFTDHIEKNMNITDKETFRII